jgi:hypothetical protein
MGLIDFVKEAGLVRVYTGQKLRIPANLIAMSMQTQTLLERTGPVAANADSTVDPVGQNPPQQPRFGPGDGDDDDVTPIGDPEDDDGWDDDDDEDDDDDDEDALGA